MIENKILQKYITGEATEEEIAEVVEWLDSHESHLQELISLRKLHNISLLNEPARTPIEKVEKKNFKI
ncbi:MAG: anti-sigma factor, partial [Prevotella sp.]|nr:anti-sigma factor [Prevotella sp.]